VSATERSRAASRRRLQVAVHHVRLVHQLKGGGRYGQEMKTTLTPRHHCRGGCVPSDHRRQVLHRQGIRKGVHSVAVDLHDQRAYLTGNDAVYSSSRKLRRPATAASRSVLHTLSATLVSAVLDRRRYYNHALPTRRIFQRTCKPENEPRLSRPRAAPATPELPVLRGWGATRQRGETDCGGVIAEPSRGRAHRGNHSLADGGATRLRRCLGRGNPRAELLADRLDRLARRRATRRFRRAEEPGAQPYRRSGFNMRWAGSRPTPS